MSNLRFSSGGLLPFVELHTNDEVTASEAERLLTPPDFKIILEHRSDLAGAQPTTGETPV
jgi:hypothetical protein